MEKIKLYDAEKEELLALGREYSVRREKILKEWEKELKKGYRYERCNTPEMLALEAEVKRRYGEILEKYKALRAEQDQDQSSTESRVADCNPALFMPIFRLCLWEYILYRTGSVRFGKGVSNDKTQCRDGKQQRTEPGVRTPAAEPPAVCRRYRRKWSRHQRRGGSGQHRRRSL